MNTNQAFEILKNTGGPTAARIIIGHIGQPSKIRIWWIARQLRRGVPVAKIVGEKWFYGMRFYTNRHTLDPRPDSETLVTAVIESRRTQGPTRVLDLGTGTGCLVAAIIKHIPNATGVGIDRSRGAIRVAKKNIRDLGLDARIEIQRGDFNKPKTLGRGERTFDIIVSNPPYIAMGDARVNRGAMFDPKMALYAKNGGYGAYESIAKNARKCIRNGGEICLEIGADMGDTVREIFTRHGWVFENSWNDLSGVERVLCFRSQ